MNEDKIFNTETSLNRFNSIEMNEFPFYFSCLNCKEIPEVILSDNENLFIFCNNCKISNTEKIKNVVNYSSKWISNNIIKFCTTKHKKKILSNIFCKTCKLFLCNECLDQHKINNENHEFIELNKLKINFCYFHNKNSNKFCFDCNEEICEECLKEHNKHKIEKIIIDNKNLENFKNFLENAEISKKNKYMFLKEIIIKLEDLNKNESKKELNDIIEKMIEIFYNDLKIAQNLIFFSKILFISCEKIKVFSDIRKKQFDTLIKIINKYFEYENFENFQNIINNEKYKFLNYFAKISKDIYIFNKKIKELFSQSKGNKNFTILSDFEKTNNFIEFTIDYSGILKKEITIDKIDNPHNYIDIDKTLNNIENINKNINSNESEFILSLIGKYLEKNGAKLNILKKNERKN